MFSNKPNYAKLKTNLRLSINRLKLLEKKKTELALKARREIADYIAAGKDDRARIRVEHIVREDYLVEAMEIVEMFCDMMLARFGMIERMNELDPGIEEAVATLLWVAPRLSADVQELQEVSKQLTAKYGKEYAEMCQRNGFQKANEKVVHKISFAVPPRLLIENYLIEIAKSFKVPFEPDPIVMMGEPPEVNNLIDFCGDMSTQHSTGLSYNPSFTPDSSATHIENSMPPNNIGAQRAVLPTDSGDQSSQVGPQEGLSTAELKHLEAMGGDAQHPAQSGVGPGSGSPYPIGNCTELGAKSCGDSDINNTQQPPHPQVFGLHYNPFDAQMSWPNEQLPPLPPYEEVMNSPTQYPSTCKSSSCGPSFPTPPEEFQPSPRELNQPPGQFEDSQTDSVSAHHSEGATPQLPDVPSDDWEFPGGLPSVPSGSVGNPRVDSDDVNFDDLARRFEELKKRK